VADLMPEMAEQGAVRLIHLDPQLLPVNVIPFGQIEGDHAILVSGEHLLRGTRQQVERQAEFRVNVAPDDGQPQFMEFRD
jgi:hypothetical protein